MMWSDGMTDAEIARVDYDVRERSEYIGSPANEIHDGATEVRIFQEMVEVNAEIYTIGGFSAHADQGELLKWHGRTGSPARTFLVHGETAAMEVLAGRLADTRVEMPELHQSFEL